MNRTFDDDSDAAGLGTSAFALTTISALLGTLGILGNGLVLVVLIGVKELHTITNLFIVNQSAIDMTSSIFLFVAYVAPHPSVPTRRWAAVFICAVWNSNYILWASVITSTFNLVLLTLERYFAVVHPVIYRSMFTYRRAAVMAFLPWLLGFGYEVYWAFVNRYSDGRCIIRYINFGVQAFIGCMTFITQFLFPLTVMAFVYISIVKSLRLRVAKRSSPDENHAGNTVKKTTLSKARKNVIKTLFVVCVTFAICWAPNQMIYLYFNLGGTVDFDGAFFYITAYMAFINTCVNPFIYAFNYHTFQKGLYILFGLKLRVRENNSATPTPISAS